MDVLLAAGYGLIGGSARAFVGILKQYRRNPGQKQAFSTQYLILTVLGSSIIGVFAGMLVATHFALPLLAGYAGMDVIEGMVKAKMRK
jgi:F0F1-type ATP synthase membrane subunit c/vacuolar-type H+-ATPase subunit K